MRIFAKRYSFHAFLKTGVNAMLPPDERGGLGEGTRVSIVESFWLATTGGAEALGLPTGTFEQVAR